MAKGKNYTRLFLLFLAALAVAGAAKFWHYNYIAHTENARNLRLPGLIEFVCKGVPYDTTKEACGNRSVWGEADWGITSYLTVYGIESKAEAEAIAGFLIDRRRQSGQEQIPINLRAYSTPRAEGREPKNAKIFDKDL